MNACMCGWWLYLHKGNTKNLFLALEVFEEDQLTRRFYKYETGKTL